jgi:hypothetical protein
MKRWRATAPNSRLPYICSASNAAGITKARLRPKCGCALFVLFGDDTEAIVRWLDEEK